MKIECFKEKKRDKKEIFKVKVFYDGTYEVEEEEVNDNAATQHLYITEKGKFGEVYVCPKE